jgi:hypothetical protein
MRIKWTSSFPNPPEVSRFRYYNYKIKDNVVYVQADDAVIDYTVSQLKEFYTPEVGSWEDIFKTQKIKAD